MNEILFLAVFKCKNCNCFFRSPITICTNCGSNDVQMIDNIENLIDKLMTKEVLDQEEREEIVAYLSEFLY